MRARSGQSSLTLLALLCAQCASSPRERFVARRASVAPAAPMVDPGPPLSEGAPTLQWIPRVYEIEREAKVFDGPSAAQTHVLLSSVRATLQGTSVQIAPQRPIEPFEGAARTAGGWLFLTERGRLFFAQSFLGPLTALDVARLAPPRRRAAVSRVGASRGALAWTDFSDRAWLATEQGGALIDSGESRAIAFVSPTRGALVTIDGRLLARDGDRLTPVELRGLAAADVRAHGEQLVVRTSEGLRELRADHTLAPVASPPVVPRLSHEQQLALLAALGARWPRAIAPPNEEWPLPAESVHSVGRDLVRFDGRTGALRSVHRDAIPSARCVLDAWGERVVVSCFESRIEALWSPVGGLASSPFAFNDGSLYLSDDGAHALVAESCRAAIDHERRAERSGLCAFGPWGRWRPALPAGAVDQVLALRGATALVLYGESRLAALDLDHRTLEPLNLASGDDDLPAVVDAAIGADHSIAVLARRAEDDTPRSLTVFARGAQRAVALPADTPDSLSLAAVDERRVAVSGTTAGFVRWLDPTSDAWSAVNVAPEAQRERLTDAEYNAPRWSCAADGCLSERAWLSYAPAPGDDAVIFDSAPPQPTTLTTPRPRALRRSLLRPWDLDCEPRAALRPTDAGFEHTHWGRARIVARAQRPEGARIELAWTTVEQPGRTLRAEGTVELSVTGNALDRGAEQGWRVAIGTDRFALIERCTHGGRHFACDRFIATPRGGLRPLRGLERFSYAAVALRRADGAVALFAEGLHDEFSTFALLDRDGALLAQSATILPRERERAPQIAMRGAQVGYLLLDLDSAAGPSRFRVVFDGDRGAASSAPELAAPPLTRALRFCARPPSRGAFTMLVSTPSRSLWFMFDEERGDSLWRFEEEGAKWCVRRFSSERPLSWPGALDPSSTAQRSFASMAVDARADGEAAGSAIIGHQEQSARCASAP